jgi:hypothetical protein
MRVLLQNTETKLYFVDTDEWTDDPLKATDFEQVEQAAEAYHTRDLAYARIIIEPGPPARNAETVSQLLRSIQAAP